MENNKIEMRTVIKKNPILAIMRNIPMEDTVDYIDMAERGGVSIFELALNSQDPQEQISILREKRVEKCLIGAGTAITVEKAESAIRAGAQFLLTPGTPEDVLEYCAARSIPLLPGVMTPYDVAVCLKYGFRTMKLFPAGSMPAGYVRNLKGPYDDTEYVAIGGVTQNNISSFFEDGYL